MARKQWEWVSDWWDHARRVVEASSCTVLCAILVCKDESREREDGGSEEGCNSGNSEELSESGYILKL